MIKLLKKIAGQFLIASVILVSFAPIAIAQDVKYDVLGDIKSKLESEGIAVIDYGAPEGKWGALPIEWINFLSKNYNSIADLGSRNIAGTKLEDAFIGEGSLTDLRRQLAILAAEKSRLTLQSEIEEKQAEIDELKGKGEPEDEDYILGEIPAIEETTKDFIADEVISDLENYIKDLIEDGLVSEAEDLDKEEGINLIFSEVDFYFNYSKWGRLPFRIIGILELGTNYKSLQDIVGINKLPSESGIQDLQEELSNLEVVTPDGATLQLSESDIELIIESTYILTTPGEAQLTQVGRAVANTIKNLAGALAVIWIVLAGVRMILAQGDENIITEQKRAITFGVIGLVAILLVDRGIDVIYGPAGAVRQELTPDQGFSNEVLGVVTWIKALIGTLAILFIVIAGIKTLFATGEEEKITTQKKALLWIGVGLILIAINEIIINNIFIIPTQQSDQIKASNITSIINTIGGVLQFLLGFVGLIAFGALIYGAATMIMNYGNDEMVEKAKKIIRNAIIGILVILSAYTIVATLVVFR